MNYILIILAVFFVEKYLFNHSISKILKYKKVEEIIVN